MLVQVKRRAIKLGFGITSLGSLVISKLLLTHDSLFVILLRHELPEIIINFDTLLISFQFNFMDDLFWLSCSLLDGVKAEFSL